MGMHMAYIQASARWWSLHLPIGEAEVYKGGELGIYAVGLCQAFLIRYLLSNMVAARIYPSATSLLGAINIPHCIVVLV